MSADTQKLPFDINALLRRLLPLICIGVLINLLFTWYAGERGQWTERPRFSLLYLLLAAALSLIPWFWHCVRLAIWGRFFGVKISNRNLFRIVVATDVGGSITPQAVGGAPVKLTMLVQQGYSPGKAATLTLLGSMEDVSFFCMAIPVSLALTRPWENPLWKQAGLFLERNGLLLSLAPFAGLGVYGLYRKYGRRRTGDNAAARWQHWSDEFKETLRLVFQQGRKPFVLSVLAISAQWMTRFCILLAVLLSLGLPKDLLQFFLLQWMVFVAMLFTPTPGATGGAEAAFLVVFGKIIPKSTVGTVLAGWRFLTYYFMLLAGVLILWLLRERAAE